MIAIPVQNYLLLLVKLTNLIIQLIVQFFSIDDKNLKLNL